MDCFTRSELTRREHQSKPVLLTLILLDSIIARDWKRRNPGTFGQFFNKSLHIFICQWDSSVFDILHSIFAIFPFFARLILECAFSAHFKSNIPRVCRDRNFNSNFYGLRFHNTTQFELCKQLEGYPHIFRVDLDETLNIYRLAICHISSTQILSFFRTFHSRFPNRL